MVPRVTKKGTSFKGAGLYYLHDKKARTSERVEFTLTQNLPTDDAEKAMRFMAYTAMRQAELKAQSGQVKTGNKLKYPVYAYSLSWSPDERHPGKEAMIETAMASLEMLGLQEHEAVLVAHNDEPQPHIHVIVNRVHPRTGIAAVLSLDHNGFSRWAEDYERKQGKILCKQRVENNEKRRRGQFVKHRDISKADFHRWRKARLKAAFDRRQIEQKNLAATHRGEQHALFDEKERRITILRQMAKERNRPQWAALFRRHREEKRALNRSQQSAYGRFLFFLKNHRNEPDLRKTILNGIRAVAGRDNPHSKISSRQESERKALAADISRLTREAIKAENEHYRNELAHLKKLQRGETEKLQDAHTKESEELAREIAEGRDEERYLDAVRRQEEEFEREVGRRIRKRKDRKRGARDKDKGRERE